MARLVWCCAVLTAGSLACGGDFKEVGADESSTDESETGDEEEGTESSESGTESSDATTGTGDTGETETEDTGETGDVCPMPPTPCDGDGDAAHTIGLCDDALTVMSGGNPEAYGALAQFGGFMPTEGAAMWAIGSGFVAELDDEPDQMACNDDLGMEFDPGTMLPAPLDPTDIAGNSCVEEPALIGTGDCSNTLQTAFGAAPAGAFDYTELRLTGPVPDNATSFSFNLAFFSTEWPGFFGSQFNDLAVVWLESEAWTGNVSYSGRAPISLNATDLVDLLDADTANMGPMGDPHPTCPTGAGCEAPRLDGTCMEGHGGSPWLTTRAPVSSGEDITLVFAVMDLGDSILDSYALIDGFAWGCEDLVAPVTDKGE